MQILFGNVGFELLLALAYGSRNFAQDHGWRGVGDPGGWDTEVMGGHVSKILGFIEASYTLTEINRNDRVEALNPAIDYTFLKLYQFLHQRIPFKGPAPHHNPFNISAALIGHEFVYDPESELGLKWEPRVDEILEIYSNNGYKLEGTDDDEMVEGYKSLFEDPRKDKGGAGGGCFVATAVYGEEDHVNLIVLRSFRDNFLKKYALGRGFIALYYKHGPKLAEKVADSELLRSLFTPLVELGVFIVKLFRLG